MKIIHTSDFKNNTILAHRGIKCVIRGYAFVKDTKKWLAKKYQDHYAFEDITLEELCKNCTLITDEDKNDPDVLNNLFDVTYEPCLELTVPETTDAKGTVLGGEKFGTYKIRINSALNNKIRKGIQGTYRAIVLIGEKYTEDQWHVITENKSYIAMFIYFDGSEPKCQGESASGLEIGENSAYTINLQFSLSQLSDIPDGKEVELDADYAKIMQQSVQKDQTTIKLSLPGIFLVPSGKEYKNRVEIEDNVKIEHEGIAYMDKTFNLIPNTYKNNNIFNVTPRVNIFDEHDDKFVKPQMLLSYGKKTEGGTFDAQSIGFEYDPRYFKMNEKAPSAATRFDLFGGATKRETSTYDDTRFDPMSGYLRLLCDRGYNLGGEDNLFIKANDVYADMSHGSMIIADDNRVEDNTQTTHIIDSRGTRASGLSAGHIIDSEKIYTQNMNGLTAFASQQASATADLPGYDKTKDDPYRCPDCEGTGKIEEKEVITHYIAIIHEWQNTKYYYLVADGRLWRPEPLCDSETPPTQDEINAILKTKEFVEDDYCDSEEEARVVATDYCEDSGGWAEPYDIEGCLTETKTHGVKYYVAYIAQGLAVHRVAFKVGNTYESQSLDHGGNVSKEEFQTELDNSDLVTAEMGFDTAKEAEEFLNEICRWWDAGHNDPPKVSGESIWVLTKDVEGGHTYETCPRCGGDGRYGNYSLPGRLAMMGLNVSSMEFNGYNNFFIGHKGLMSNFGHDAIIFGNHNACGNKEYNMCQTCLGTGLVECTACMNGTDHPTGKISAHPNVTCSSCYGFGYVNYSAEKCMWCSGTGSKDGQTCPICLGRNSHSGVDPEHWETPYTCSAYTAVTDAIYQCQLCGGTKTIVDETQTVEMLCSTCSGYGQMKDPVCSGMGFIQDNEHQMQTSACPTCSETMMTCPVCSGKGYSGDASSGDRCDFCGGDKRVCIVCEGTGEHTCPDCNGDYTNYPCPECNIGEPEMEVCPICRGQHISNGSAYASVTDKNKIMAFLPSGSTSDTHDLAHDLYIDLLGTGGTRCERCWGQGTVQEHAYIAKVDAEYTPVAYIKETGTTLELVDKIEDATIFENSTTVEQDIRDRWHVDHPDDVLRNQPIVESCPDCNGTGSTDGYILCPCCNKLFTNKFLTTTAYIGSVDWGTVGVFTETIPYTQYSNTFSALKPTELCLIDSRYCGHPGSAYKTVTYHRNGFHECDFCGGRKFLVPSEFEKLAPYVGDDVMDALERMGYGYNSSPHMMQAMWFGGTYGSPIVGMLCPRCCDLKAVSAEAEFYNSHDKPSEQLNSYIRAFSGMNMYEAFTHKNLQDTVLVYDGEEWVPTVKNMMGYLGADNGYTAACNACNYLGEAETVNDLGKIICPTCNEGVVPCEACNGARHWLCPTCSGRGEVDFRPIVAYEDGKVIAVGDGYFYKNLMPDQDNFNMYRDYVNIKPENNCDLDVGQYLKRMNLFSVENHGLLTVHNNNYDEVPDSNVKHQIAADFFAVRSWAKYDSLQERFANLQNGCYAPDAIYFTKRTAHNEEWKLRIRELDYLIHDSYIKTNASWLKTAALNQAISEFYKKNNTFTLRLGPIITYAWKGVKGSKGAKGTKGWKGRKGVKGVTLGLKGKKGMKGMKGLKGTKGYKGMTLQVVNKRYKYYIEDILAAVRTEFGKYISNNGNLGKNPETYTFYCVNGDPTENLYFKGVRLRKMANGNYQTLNAVKGIKPAQVQRIVYKDNGYYGEYGVMNFNYAYSNKFLT